MDAPHKRYDLLKSDIAKDGFTTQWSEAKIVAITAGASAPEVLVQALIEKLAIRFELTVEDVAPTRETVTFKLPRILSENFDPA